MTERGTEIKMSLFLLYTRNMEVLALTTSGQLPLKPAFQRSIELIRDGYAKDWIYFSGYQSANDSLDRQQYEPFEQVMESDKHSYAEICICIDGSFCLQLDEHVYELHEGTAALLFPGVVHNEYPRIGIDYTAIWIAVDDLNNTVVHLSGKNEEKGFYTVQGYSFKPDFPLYEQIMLLQQEKDYKFLYYLEKMKAQVMGMIIEVVRNVSKFDHREEDVWKEYLVGEVKKYVRQHENQQITLSEIGKHICISVNYLNNVFKSVTGTTVMQYIENNKIAKAKQLLLLPGYSVKRTAAELGYYDPYHFSKMFKKETGMSPREYVKGQQTDHKLQRTVRLPPQQP